ncbi:MAG: type II toxin-antitoxin system HipA family toxin [Spirochaetaceae bacterium]|nr:type II toxin-antitoxin system HipA family toxin [Spirochaetaceae bacterium]
MSKIVQVKLWGTSVGYLGYAPDQKSYATFEYDPAFMESGVQISPIRMKYPPSIFTLDQLALKSFKGVPGFVADSLPDKYGDQLIDIYMAEKNIPSHEVTSLDRLLYVADRGMGALEYHPGETLSLQRTALDIQKLSELANLVLQKKEDLQKRIHSAEDRASALSFIRIGSSAGGARSKALIALSPKGKLLDGTVNHGTNYTYWLLKFDSPGNQDRDKMDPKGMPMVEYIYSIIAKKSGIRIPNTRLLENGREKHYLIERFDRIIRKDKVDKLHYVSWAGLGHADRDKMNSYEQLVLLVRQMGLGQDAVTEIFRRAVFNVLGRNQDDHTKNTGFLMDRSGSWKLAPAFDLTYSYDPYGRWTSNHQCWLSGKNNQFDREDLMKFGSYCNLPMAKSRGIIYKVREAFGEFSNLAEEYGLPHGLKNTIEENLRLGIVTADGS